MQAWQKRMLRYPSDLLHLKEILQRDYDRIKVADFGREQTKRSNAGAKRYKRRKRMGEGKRMDDFITIDHLKKHGRQISKRCAKVGKIKK